LAGIATFFGKVAGADGSRHAAHATRLLPLACSLAARIACLVGRLPGTMRRGELASKL
jgi:hypothetical protein